MKKRFISLFIFSFSFVVSAQDFFDELLSAIKNNQFDYVDELAQVIDLNQKISPAQFKQLEGVLAVASPEIIAHIGSAVLGLLQGSHKEDLADSLDECQQAPTTNVAANGVTGMLHSIANDKKAWLLWALSNTAVLAQNTTNDQAFISQNDWNDVHYWSRCTFILAWTLVAILVIAPAAGGLCYCCCGGKSS